MVNTMKFPKPVEIVAHHMPKVINKIKPEYGNDELEKRIADIM